MGEISQHALLADDMRGYELHDRMVESLLMAETSVWMSTKQAAAYLGVNLRTLYRFIDEGGLPAFKFGRVIRLRQHDVEAFVESARIAPGSLEHLYPEPTRQAGR